MVYEMKVPPYYKLQGSWVQTRETIDPDPRKGALGTEGQSPPNEKQRPMPRLIQDYINNWWEEGFRSETTALPKTVKGGIFRALILTATRSSPWLSLSSGLLQFMARGIQSCARSSATNIYNLESAFLVTNLVIYLNDKSLRKKFG